MKARIWFLRGLICHSGNGLALTCREFRAPADRAARSTPSARVWRKRAFTYDERPTGTSIDSEPHLMGLARRWHPFQVVGADSTRHYVHEAS